MHTRFTPEVPPLVKPSAQTHVLSGIQVEFAAVQTHPPCTKFASEPAVHVLHTVASLPFESCIEYVLPRHGEQTVFVVAVQVDVLTIPSPQTEHNEQAMSRL